MSLRRHLPGALTAALALAGSALAAAAPAPPEPRLEGLFLLAGRVTVADNVPGEHAGQLLLRNWRFLAQCATGPCNQVVLVRGRAHGTDTVRLHRRSLGYYVGHGRFYAPLRCGKTIYSRGASVPYLVAIRVTASQTVGASTSATRIRATYINKRRTNHTRCVGVLGHDAAAYHGHRIG